jgi:spore maturation protein CgeB
MRILFAAQKYDYGQRDRGYSFEYYNFYTSLRDMGHDVEYFDLGEADGTQTLSSRLVDRVEVEQPDLLFTVLFRDELVPDAIGKVSASGRTLTYNWFCDDHWRFESFSRLWAPHFNFVSTTVAAALPEYRAAGIDNVLLTQWAAAVDRYRPAGLPLAHDVTFVGQNYGDRSPLIRELRRAGLDVKTWGTGWAVPAWQRKILERRALRPVGGAALLERRNRLTRCTQDEMVQVFEQSRVSLNLTGASSGSENQIKGRTFEIPACRGFLLTGPAAELRNFYEPGAEALEYDDPSELPELCRRVLRDERWRERICEAGYRRTLAEHTYRQRFTTLFRQMGLPG